MEINNKEYPLHKAIKRFKRLDKENFYFVDAKLKCPHCNKAFGIDRKYIGIVTCPYCGEYVEG